MLLRILVTIAIIGSLAVGGYFVKEYYDSNDKAEALTAQIQTTKKTIATVATQTQNLEKELSEITRKYTEAQLAIDVEQDLLPERINSNVIVRSILLLGKDSGVTVIPLSTQDWANVKIGKHNYSVFRMNIQVNGSEDEVIRFIEKLQYSVFDTLAIENMSVAKNFETPTPTPSPSPSPTVTPTPTPVITVTVDVNLAIYAK